MAKAKLKIEDTEVAAAPDAAAAAEPEIISVKGFGLDWKCRDFQFEIGKSYEHVGKVEACKSGFHAIEGHPLEVFSYYGPATSRYAIVRQSGTLRRESDDSKVASAKITIEAELKIPDLVKRAWDWVWSQAKLEYGASATGELGAASATGYQGAASATGNRGAASATGNRGAASATGELGAASATGELGAASATGYQGAASATGELGAASATGYQGAASATGNRGAAMASGRNGKAMGAEGCAIFLVHRDFDWNITHAWAGIVGRGGIKPNIFYVLNEDGKPVEAT